MNMGDEKRGGLEVQGAQFRDIRAAAETVAATRQDDDFRLDFDNRPAKRKQQVGIQCVCFFRPVEEDSGDRSFAFHFHHAFII